MTFINHLSHNSDLVPCLKQKEDMEKLKADHSS